MTSTTNDTQLAIYADDHSEHEQRTSDMMSSDEEAEVRHRTPAEPLVTNNNAVSKACEIIRIIKPLHGRDNMDIEDFLKKVQLAKNSCSEPTLLLQLILAEKIFDQAENSIRYTKIDTYSELFEALRTQVSMPASKASPKVQAFSNYFRGHSEL